MTGPMHKLLIVDDEAAIHRALARTLRREPYELLHAHDAREAWAMLGQHPDIRAVVSDQCMPGPTGLELLVRVREQHPHVVTVLVTGQADLPLALGAINDGRVHRLFTKPWNPTRLRADLRDLLGLAARAEPEKPSGLRATLGADDETVRDEATGAFIIDESTLP